MKKILLVEPDYRSKFPPLGLMRISTYHKSRNDRVFFTRGCNKNHRRRKWDRVYISSLITWELPKTVKTIRYYSSCVRDEMDIIVGGIAATLLPDYIKQNAVCKVIEGQLDRGNMLGLGSPAISKLIPDYDILGEVDYQYYPTDAYFSRITKGCIRKCKFCAVPLLEKTFGFLSDLGSQIEETDKRYGTKHNLVIMDNNILGIPQIEDVILSISDLGFHAGAKRNNWKRSVDFNQGIDARIIALKPRLAKMLAKISLSPVRLAFDFVGMEKAYRKAVELLAAAGFKSFTNYMLFNYKDTPRDLYHRFRVNADLNRKLGIRITGFPMRFIPMNDIRRKHVSDEWRWRYLRGIQCVLLATRGLVSPNPEFTFRAFGQNYSEFLRILSMPDRYIIYREYYENNGCVDAWRKEFSKLSKSSQREFLDLLHDLKNPKIRKIIIGDLKKYARLLEHYYPNGDAPPRSPEEESLLHEGICTD